MLDNAHYASTWFGDIGGYKGTIRGFLEVTEYRDQTRGWEEAVSKGEFVWGKEALIQLPSATASFHMKVFTIDGKEIIVDGDDSPRWFSVSWSPNAKHVIVRPKPLNEAFR